jgi:hypothetical protein
VDRSAGNVRNTANCGDNLENFGRNLASVVCQQLNLMELKDLGGILRANGFRHH